MAYLESNLTTAEVQRIHGKRTAVKDRVYTDEIGDVYVGLADGRLDLQHKISGDVTGNLAASVVSEVGGIKAANIIGRCESIALTIALG